MKARVVAIESGKQFTDGKERVTLRIDGCDSTYSQLRFPLAKLGTTVELDEEIGLDLNGSRLNAQQSKPRTVTIGGQELSPSKVIDLLARYKQALEGLTPGGSEFVNDPEKCAAHVRERQDSLWEQVKQLKVRERQWRSAP